MSTVSYALITARREKSTPSQSRDKEPPGVGTYVDILAALVPGEVLTLHALYLERTMTTTDSGTVITHPKALFVGFFLMIIFSSACYVVPKVLKKQWIGGIDYYRAAIPAVAFIAWTLIQKETAFDAVLVVFDWSPRTAEVPRFLVASSLAFLLALIAGNLAKKADLHPTGTGNKKVGFA